MLSFQYLEVLSVSLLLYFFLRFFCPLLHRSFFPFTFHRFTPKTSSLFSVILLSRHTLSTHHMHWDTVKHNLLSLSPQAIWILFSPCLLYFKNPQILLHSDLFLLGSLVLYKDVIIQETTIQVRSGDEYKRFLLRAKKVWSREIPRRE